MIKRTITVYEFTEEDKQLLNTPLPYNPCATCGSNYMCGGWKFGNLGNPCESGKIYKKAIEPYRKAGIYEFACKIAEVREIKEKIRKLEEQLEVVQNAIPEAVLELLNHSVLGD